MKLYLAQVNVARMVASLEDPAMAEFVSQLDEINAQGRKAGQVPNDAASQRQHQGITPEAVNKLMDYHWPGTIESFLICPCGSHWNP